MKETVVTELLFVKFQYDFMRPRSPPDLCKGHFCQFALFVIGFHLALHTVHLLRILDVKATGDSRGF